MTIWPILAAVVVGTWNGNWFPSGRAEHRAHPDVEAATMTAAAGMLRGALDSIDPKGTNDVILCLHEFRGPRVASNVVAQIGRKGLRVVSVSGYRRRDRFDMQQDVIATTLPVAETGWKVWRKNGNDTPPRGYAFAAVVLAPATTAAVYAVHLKSNYGATTPEAKASNRAKRGAAIRQLVNLEKPKAGGVPSHQAALIVGDFNADRWKAEFAGEPLFKTLEGAGFLNVIGLLPEGGRGTYPNKRYGDSALDYIMTRGLVAGGPPKLISSEGLSDHFAVFAVLNSEK